MTLVLWVVRPFMMAGVRVQREHCFLYLFYSLSKNDRPNLSSHLKKGHLMLFFYRKHRPGRYYTEFA